MENLTKEQFSELIEKYKDSFYMICAGNGALKSNDCALHIAISEESAKKFFDSIIDSLPNEMKEFSVIKMVNFNDVYSFGKFFDRPSFKYIYLIDFGFIPKDHFIKKNLENVEFICERLKGFKDNDLIYSVYKKDNNAFCPTEEFKQFFFSNTSEVTQFINQYNNEELGLYSSSFEIDLAINGYFNDLLDICFDGRYCSGWDVIEAIYRIYNTNTLNEDDIENLIKSTKLGILAATDRSNYIMMQRNNTIFFTSAEKAKKFSERNKNVQTHNFSFYTIEKLEAFENLIGDSKVIYIDGEKHCSPLSFLIGLGLRNKQKNWESMDEVKEKAISLWNKDKLYIILSMNNVNSNNNTSIPYIVSGNSQYLWIFEDFEAAKRFAYKVHGKTINNNYLVGIIDNSKAIWSLKTTLLIANALNIPEVEFNTNEYECIHFPIKDFFEFNNTELTNNFSTLVPAGSENANYQVHFNPFSFELNRDMFYKNDWKPIDEIQTKILNAYKKIYFPTGYSKKSYQLFYYIVEHFVRYSKATQTIKFYKAITLIDFIKNKTENDFFDMISSYQTMDNGIINEEWSKVVEDLKEITNNIDTESIKNLLRDLRDLLFDE